MSALEKDIVLNYHEILDNIEEAKKRGAHSAQNVQLVAVSKTVDVETIKYAVSAGATVLGENKVQEIQAKFEGLPGVKWHLIGHLQTNKVKYIVDKVEMIHSLDSLNLAKEIEKRFAAADRIIPCLIQVNIAEEESKWGMKEEEVLDFCKAMVDFPHIQIMGLMTVGPFVEPEEIRPVFARLRELRDETAEQIKDLNLPNVKMQELSMGMSHDYTVAVEEGATMVRVGSALFGPRIYR